MKKFFKKSIFGLTLSIFSLIIFNNLLFSAGPTAYVGTMYTLFEETGDPTQCVFSSTATAQNVSFLTAGTYGDCSSTDPWDCSALIEFDKPKATTAYPDHCLGLCANIVCVTTTTAGGDFPINEVTFEIFKFEGQVGGNLEDENIYPTIRSISLDTTSVSCDTSGTTYSTALCTAWDAHYPFEGNFAKTNGQFGFRARMAVDYPGDGINFDRITIDDVSAYPGVNQIPVQVDVSDVHSVTSSNTVVGTAPSVAASPYYLNYRLSKDSEVTIRIYDEEGDTLHRTLITNQPRIGEGIPTPSLLNSDAWDGRNDNGRILPAGNYVSSITSRAFDEFDYAGANTADISRSKTHQVSLDPLQITDIAITGLSKQSTSYAKLDFMLTESAKVYWEIYEPGTTFNTLYTDTSVEVPGSGGPSPTAANQLVARYVEQKPLRTLTNLKWDGTCNATSTVSACNAGSTYGAGTPLVDGDYVYTLWAEIPYLTTASTTNVKTVQFYTGYIPIERGVVDIAIQPVGYTTVGSSPTAYGIDPFIFKYSISRDAPVTMKVKTADGSLTARTFFTEEVQQANFENQYTWDGLNNDGRFVGPGTYRLEIETRDPLYPNDVTKISTESVFFPIDMFRVVDVDATDLLGTEGAMSEISYSMSKAMDVDLRIYPLGTVIDNSDASDWPPAAIAGTEIKTFTGMRPGGDLRVTEEWDGLNENTGAMVEDGDYPFLIYARSTTPATNYYDYPTDPSEVLVGPANLTSIDATDRQTGFIRVVRGPIDFDSSSLKVVPTQPTLIYTSGTVPIPPYEVQFKVLRQAEVKVDILSTVANSSSVCGTAGTVCKTLTIPFDGTSTNGQIFEPDLTQSLFWDAKDSEGSYVPRGGYRIRYTAQNYPDATLQQDVIRYVNFNVDYDVYDVERTFINPQSESALIAYQVSVPMKIGIQIFKPGTGIDSNGSLLYQGSSVSDVYEVLVKSITGIRTERIGLEDYWDGTDFALQKVPDGNYIFRFTSSTDYRAVDSVTGGLATGYTTTSIADIDAYTTSYNIEVGSGDSGFVCDDWENYTIFYPNPLRQASGTVEITKIPVPGTVSIKVYNLAADLVRTRNYSCIDLDGGVQNMGESLTVSPNFTFSSPSSTTTTLRNAELRCTWDKKNNHGKNVARGIYFVMVEFKATAGGGQHCYAVEKVLIP